ncbi:hypothetical protein, partial [Ohessyouella blattaphilus]
MDSVLVKSLNIFFMLFLTAGVMKSLIKSFVHDLVTPNKQLRKYFGNKMKLVWVLFISAYLVVVWGCGIFVRRIPILIDDTRGSSVIGIYTMLVAYVFFNVFMQRGFWKECGIENNNVFIVIKRIWQISVYLYSGMVLCCVFSCISGAYTTRIILFAAFFIYSLCSIICYFYYYFQGQNSK